MKIYKKIYHYTQWYCQQIKQHFK